MNAWLKFLLNSLLLIISLGLSLNILICSVYFENTNTSAENCDNTYDYYNIEDSPFKIGDGIDSKYIDEIISEMHVSRGRIRYVDVVNINHSGISYKLKLKSGNIISGIYCYSSKISSNSLLKVGDTFKSLLEKIDENNSEFDHDLSSFCVCSGNYVRIPLPWGTIALFNCENWMYDELEETDTIVGFCID